MVASGSRSGGRGSDARGSSSSHARAAEVPSADAAALLGPMQLNPILAAMPAAELVAHLNLYRRTADFIDAVHVFAARERRLAEAEALIRAGDEGTAKLRDELRARDRRLAEAEGLLRAGEERMDKLRDEISALQAEAKIRRAAETEAALREEIRARDLSALEAEAKISRAAETEAALRAKICTLQLGAAALLSSGIGASGSGLTQQAAGHGGREPVVPQDFIAAATEGGVGFGATGVQSTSAAFGEVRVPMKIRPEALWSRPAPHLRAGAAPLPHRLIGDDQRAAEQAARGVLNSNKEAEGEREISEAAAGSSKSSAPYTAVDEDSSGGSQN